jgi:hypothetical protein
MYPEKRRRTELRAALVAATKIAAGLAALLVLASCGDDGDDGGGEFTSRGSGASTCQQLQSYYDGCCDTCGARDSYCGSDYDVSQNSEASCRSQLADENTSRCLCDLI